MKRSNCKTRWERARGVREKGRKMGGMWSRKKRQESEELEDDDKMRKVERREGPWTHYYFSSMVSLFLHSHLFLFFPLLFIWMIWGGMLNKEGIQNLKKKRRSSYFFSENTKWENRTFTYSSTHSQDYHLPFSSHHKICCSSIANKTALLHFWVPLPKLL
jgi:hypothetical protein